VSVEAGHVTFRKALPTGIVDIGGLTWSDGLKRGHAETEGHVLDWRWDDVRRSVEWRNGSTRWLHFLLGRVQPGRVDLTRANLRIDAFRLNLDGTNIRWRSAGANSSAGLYEGAQSIVELLGEVDAVALKALGDRVGQDDLLRHGSEAEWLGAFDDLQDAVRLRTVTIDPRRVDRRLDIGDPALDQCLHMLAKDFNRITLDFSRLDRLVEIGGSHSQAATQLVAQELTGRSPDRWLEDQEKLLLANLSQELMGDGAKASGGTTSRLMQSAGAVSVNFFNDTEVASQRSWDDGWLTLGYRESWIDTQMPLFDAASYTQLGFRTQADVAHVGWRQEVLPGAPVALAVEGLAYVANIRDDVQVAIGGRWEQEREEFLQWNGEQGLLLGLVDDESVNRIPLPGGFAGVRASGWDDRWHLRYRAVPYLPLRLAEGLGASSGSGLDGIETGGTIGYAEDITGGWRQPIAGRSVSVAVHKDVADRFEVAPSAELAPWLNVGVRMGQARFFGDLLTQFVETRWGESTLSVAVQQDEAHQADGYEVRVGRPWGARQLEVGMFLKRYASGDGEGVAPLEEQLSLRVIDPSGRQRLVCAIGEDEIEQTRSIFAGVERLVSDALQWKGGVEVVNNDEQQASLRGSLGMRWLF